MPDCLKVGVFHPGTQHSWQTAFAFQETNQLKWYITSVFYDRCRWPYCLEQFLPSTVQKKVQREFKRRYTPILNPKLVHQCGLWEWSEIGASRLGFQKAALKLNSIGNRQYGNHVIKFLEKQPIDILWGYNTSSLEVFRWAKKRGIFCVLDQTIGHPSEQNRVLLQEQYQHPEFFQKFYQPYDTEWLDRQDEEISLADLVIVGSEYCATTLLNHGCPKQKIRIIHYGYDDTTFHAFLNSKTGKKNGVVRFLFVGQISPRKGVAYLLKAFQQIPQSQATLTLVGNRDIPLETYKRYAPYFNHIEHVPRSEVAQYFYDADCFLFPSLMEGSALVLYEACATGLGIIQSAASGNGAIPNVNGVILQKISVESIFSQISNLISNPETLSFWQNNSLQLRSNLSWSHYRDRLRTLVRNIGS